MKKRIITIGIIVFLILVSTNASSMNIQSPKKTKLSSMQTSDYDYVIQLGKMTIYDEICNIEFYDDPNINIDDDKLNILNGNQSSYYKFIVDYEFEEDLISDDNLGEEWHFEIYFNSYNGGAGKKSEDKITFIDTFSIIDPDQGSGQLWIDAYGFYMWDEQYKLTLYTYHSHDYPFQDPVIDHEQEITLKTKFPNYPMPQLEWTAPGGTDFGEVKLTTTKTKKLNLTNVGNYPTPEMSIGRTGYWQFDCDWYGLLIDPIEPGKTRTFNIEFRSTEKGEHTATIKTTEHTNYNKPWWFPNAEITLTATAVEEEGLFKDKNKRNLLILDNLIESFPFLQNLIKLKKQLS